MPTSPAPSAVTASPVAAVSGLHLLVETIGNDRQSQRQGVSDLPAIETTSTSSRARSHSPANSAHAVSKRRRLSDECSTSQQLKQQSQSNHPDANHLRQSISKRRSRVEAHLSLSTGLSASGSPPTGLSSSQSSSVTAPTLSTRPSQLPLLPSPSTVYSPSHMSFMPQSSQLHPSQQQYTQRAASLAPPPTPTTHVPSQNTQSLVSQGPALLLSKRAFVSLFESLYDAAAEDIPSLTARLKEQLRSSATLLQTLQASGNMIEELVRSCFGESYRAHLELFERGLTELRERVSAVEQRDQSWRDELINLRARVTALEESSEQALEKP